MLLFALCCCFCLLWLKLSIKSLNHKYFFLFEYCLWVKRAVRRGAARCRAALRSMCVCVFACLRRVRSWARNFWLSKVKVAAAANAVERNVVEKWWQLDGAPPDESAYKRQFKVDCGAAPDSIVCVCVCMSVSPFLRIIVKWLNSSLSSSSNKFSIITFVFF